MELIDAKDYFPAVELLREAIRFAPDKAEYRFRLGEVELKNAKWVDRGLENLKEAVRLAPSRGDFLREIARALALHGHKRDAESYARHANQVEPGPESSALLQQIAAAVEEEAVETKQRVREGWFSRIRRKKG
jgi:Flp pilus assembly protein TadD